MIIKTPVTRKGNSIFDADNRNIVLEYAGGGVPINYERIDEIVDIINQHEVLIAKAADRNEWKMMAKAMSEQVAELNGVFNELVASKAAPTLCNIIIARLDRSAVVRTIANAAPKDTEYDGMEQGRIQLCNIKDCCNQNCSSVNTKIKGCYLCAGLPDNRHFMSTYSCNFPTETTKKN